MHGFFERLSWERILGYVIWGSLSVMTWETIQWLDCPLWGWCGGG